MMAIVSPPQDLRLQDLLLVSRLSNLGEAYSAEFLLGILPENLACFVADLLLAKPHAEDDAVKQQDDDDPFFSEP